MLVVFLNPAENLRKSSCQFKHFLILIFINEIHQTLLKLTLGLHQLDDLILHSVILLQQLLEPANKELMVLWIPMALLLIPHLRFIVFPQNAKNLRLLFFIHIII